MPKTIHVHYEGKLEDGTTFDSSKSRKPLSVTLGENQVIPGFEEGLQDMNEGDTKTITIPEDNAYGPYNEKLLLHIEKNKFPEGLDPNLGQTLELIAISKSFIALFISPFNLKILPLTMYPLYISGNKKIALSKL